MQFILYFEVGFYGCDIEFLWCQIAADYFSITLDANNAVIFIRLRGFANENHSFSKHIEENISKSDFLIFFEGYSLVSFFKKSEKNRPSPSSIQIYQKTVHFSFFCQKSGCRSFFLMAKI